MNFGNNSIKRFRISKFFIILQRLFESWCFTGLLFLLYVVMLALATFIEKISGAQMAKEWVYHHPFFFLIQLLLVIQFVVLALRARLWQHRRWGILILHISFIVILLGALVTHYWGFEGIVHIREGETTSVLMQADGTRQLPFSIRLDDFKLVRYAGSRSPSSYESFLTIFDGDKTRAVHIYMNKVIFEQGYRLYQSSYDSDECGTVLTVNHDNCGTAITYIGYLLLFIGICWVMFDKHSRFRWLVRNIGKFSVLLLFLGLPFHLMGSNKGDNISVLLGNTIPKEQADKWGRLQVQCPTGRIEPVDTYTSKLLRKLYRKNSFHGLTSEQVILGFLINPSYWIHVPLIRQTNKDLAEAMSLSSDKYLCFNDFFDEEGRYVLATAVDSAYLRPVAQRTRMEKDLLKLDEKLNILYSLQTGKMFAIFPHTEDISGRWYSSGDDLNCFSGKDSMFVSKIFPWYLAESYEALYTHDWTASNEILDMINVYQQKKASVGLLTDRQVSWELFYNHADLFFWISLGGMLFGLLLLCFSMYGLLSRSVWLRKLMIILVILIFVLFLFQTFGLGVRWYIAGRAPWANAYESMIYVAWATLLAGILFMRHSFQAVALGAFWAGIILFVANLNFMDPEITPLVPVLKSYWLMIHVAVITASYGFFGMCFLLGVLSVVLMALDRKNRLQIKIHELRLINELSLYIGLFLLIIGIFLGAVWADESWGRYWGWDPKETWALITMIVYTFVLHARFIPLLSTDYSFSVMSVFALLSVLMTYFGVNYYLSGLHSYGGDGTPPGLHVIVAVFLLILFLVLLAGYRQKKDRKLQKKLL